MTKNHLITISIIILLGLAIYLVIALSKQTETQRSSIQENVIAQPSEESLMGKATNGTMDESTGSSLRELTTKYVSYNQQALISATEGDNLAVIFFHADWCPFCREAENEFLNNLSQIPSNVTILKANYDTETELKKKYAVVSQHTYVQVDADGNEITKWNGGGIQELLQNIKDSENNTM